jgi:hypothetical protein
MNAIIMPLQYEVIEKRPDNWYVKPSQVFYNPTGQPVNLNNREKKYGLTKTEIITELFKIKAGCLGFYLVDLKNRQYYYCGLSESDVQEQLMKLGIGRVDPMEERL